MKRQMIAVLVGSLFALPALADTGSRSSQQFSEWEYPVLAVSAKVARTAVLTQLTQSKRSGDFVVNAESGEKAYQRYPSAYPAHVADAGETRAEVQAELIEAERDGSLPDNAEIGIPANEL